MYNKQKNDLINAFGNQIRVLEKYLTQLESAEAAVEAPNIKEQYYCHSECVLASIVCAETITREISAEIEIANRRNDVDAVADLGKLLGAYITSRCEFEEYLAATEPLVNNETDDERIHKLHQCTYNAMLKIKKLCEHL